MAKVYVTSAGGSGGTIATGVLQLQGGAAMSVTPTVVTDQSGAASTLYLGTTITQVQSPLRVTTNNAIYLDVEDGSGNNRFTVGRDPASQEVTLDFASNPTGSTTVVGAIRTYVDGVNLSEIMTFREDGNIGINTLTPGAQLDVHSASNVIAQFNRTGAGKSWIQYLQAGSGKWNTGYDNTNGNFTIYDVVNATDRVVVTNTGRLGVGTNAPTNTFEIASTSASPFKVATTAGYFRATFQNSITSGILDFNSTNFQFPTNNVDFGTSSNLGARVGIKGSGSTSATTSLLVQNSAGSTALQILDDKVSSFGGNLYLNGGIMYTQNPTSYPNNYLYQASNITILSGVSIRLASGPVGISEVAGGANATASSILDCQSTTKGFLPPRMTTTQKNAIATPAAGLMVYDTTLNKLCVYTTAWETITSI